MNLGERLSEFFSFGWEFLDAPLFSSLLVMLVILALAAVIGLLASRADPRKPSKGLLFLAEWGYEKLEGFVQENMGAAMLNYLPYFLAMVPYCGLAFLVGLTGLPSVIDWMAAPLSMAVIMFVTIHFTAVRYQKWGYFSRYTSPIFFWLPINLITMWTPIISVSMRLFGNCLSGTIIIGLVQWALTGLGQSLFPMMSGDSAGAIFAPIPMGVLNLYFGLFSAYVQTTVYSFLCALWFAGERPEDMPSPAIEEGRGRTLEAANA